MNYEIINNFIKALVVMVKGMTGIFVVLFAIYLCIKFLIRVFPEK
jgi:Na+-transporting methylmalonyl-CoA/oxaloacetate decarboxylase gamma subunit